MPNDDPAIEALNLNATARDAAYALKHAHPDVIFTSGRRDARTQARAMAENIVQNRKWIEQTYVASTASKACQTWVNTHPGATSTAAIADGLLTVLNGLSDSQLAELSKHLSGDAFDVQPVDTHADEIKQTIRDLAGLDKFLDKEGGLVRWHAQFRPA